MKTYNTKRRLVFEGQTNAVKLLTERKQVSKTKLTNVNGASIEVSPPFPKKLKEFLEVSGMQVAEGSSYTQVRGRTEVVGVPVKVIPANHSNYDDGIIVEVEEDNEMSLKNTNRLIAYLEKHGVDMARECILWEKSEKQASCVFKEIDSNGNPTATAEQ